MFVFLGMIVATAFPPPDDLPALNLHSTDPLSQACASRGGGNYPTNMPYANLANGSMYAANLAANLVDMNPPTFNNLSTDSTFLDPSGACGSNCGYSENMTSYLLETASVDARERRVAFEYMYAKDPFSAVSVGNLNPTNFDTLSALAWYDNRAFHASPVAINFLSNSILGANANTSADQPVIITYNNPLNKTTSEKIEQYTESLVDLTVAINVIIALSFVPASFVLFLVQERVSKTKHLQYVSGAPPVAYWMANYSWDIINYLVPMVVCLIVFLAYGLPAYTGRNFPAVVVLMTLYGWSITPAMYPFNWSFSVPSTAYVSLICANLFIGLTCTLTTFILEQFQEDDPELYEIGEVLKVVFLIFPNFCLGRGLMDIAANEYIAQYRDIVDEVCHDCVYRINACM